MILEFMIQSAESTNSVDVKESPLFIELWENDNLSIKYNDGSRINKHPDFDYEITKEDAIKLAKQILCFYNVL